MKITDVIADLKRIVQGATNYQEHSPRLSEYATTPVQDAPNTGVFRVVVMGTGRQKALAGCDRYADIAIVVAEPLSGGDANKTNEEAAISAERLSGIIGDYDASEAYTDESVDATITRDAGRSIITMTARINYHYSEE
jgi:hypothetical protein